MNVKLKPTNTKIQSSTQEIQSSKFNQANPNFKTQIRKCNVQPKPS